MLIRKAKISDAEALLSIYAPYVTDTAVTFEYKVPSVKNFSDRIYNTLQKYPYYVAENNGQILGYAYAGPFKTRAAYDWAVETSIYVRKESRRSGIGRLLYSALEETLSKQNFLNLNACIAYTEKEDPFLPADSVKFHHSMGYKDAGVFHLCGYKFGRWYNMIWMEKHIGIHSANPSKIIPFSVLKESQSTEFDI